MIITFPLIGFSDWLWLVFVGQFFYGVADALSSGTIEISILSSISSLISFFIYLILLILFIFAIQFNIYIAAIAGASLFVLTACLSLVFVKINQSLN